MAAPIFSSARAVMNPPCFTGGDRAKNPAHSLTRRDAVRALIALLPPAFARLKTAKSGLSSIPPARKGHLLSYDLLHIRKLSNGCWRGDFLSGTRTG